MRPLRGTAFLDQFGSSSSPAAARRTFLQQLRPRPRLRLYEPKSIIYLQCSVHSFRHVSTVPPPKQDSPESQSSSPNRTDQPQNDPSSLSPPEPELPSHAEDRRSALSARFSTFMDNLQTRALNATQTINDLTGYTAIEAIKARNMQLETDLAAAQSRLHAARQSYKSLTSHRAATQREVTTLLARKDTWSPPDLERFTSLYRLDHELEAQVAAASAELTEAEADDARLAAELNAGILKRYHEEQIWSDRIRRQSTWGTWGLMGVNVLLFLVLQFVAEPWRRARLVKGVAENEKTVLEEVRRELAEVRATLEAGGRLEVQGGDRIDSVETETIPVEVGIESNVTPVETPEGPVDGKTGMTILADPQLLLAAMTDLYSNRRIEVRMRDVSLIALEGAVAGAAVVGGVALVLLRGR